MNPAELVVVTVTFHPELDLLKSQLHALPQECLKIVVDNASPEKVKEGIRELGDQISNLHLLENPINAGLAIGLNQGVKHGRQLRPGARWCLLLDQDSEPQPGSLDALLEGLEMLELKGEKVGCIGPLLIDAKTGLTHGFHQASKLFWRRAYPVAGTRAPVPCTNLNGSGTLVAIELFMKLGGLDETLFIDHVDTEWSFRVLARGYSLWGIPNAIFQHRMGDSSLKYWLLGWRIWPGRSPLRHRYLFRNALWLMKRSYVSPVWKFWAGVKLILTCVVHGIFDCQRIPQMKAMLQGLREGFSGARHG